MNNGSNSNQHNDNDIESSAAPLMDHLNELRSRLIWCLVAFALAFFISFHFAGDIFNWLLLPLQWAMKWRGEDPSSLTLIYTDLFEYIFAKIKIAAFGGIIIAFPVIAFQLYRFVAPGLYKNERSAFLPFLIASPLLFLVGAAMVYFLVAPIISWFALSMQQLPQAGGDLQGAAKIVLLNKVSDYLKRITSFIVIFGFVFQLPIVTSLLVKAGIFSAQGLASKRKYAILGIVIIAAIVTPPDPLSQIALALPMILLYEISIILARMIEKKQNS